MIRSVKEIETIDLGKKVYLFSQTTMDPGEFDEVESALFERLEVAGLELQANCTICSQMKRRKPELAEFAVKYDVVIFVSGKNSSNGKMLFEFCKSLNERSFWVSGNEDLQNEWFEGIHTVGISGATSTPFWQLESVKNGISELTNI